MRKLSAFIQITLNGYFADESGDISWGHHDDAEFGDFVAGNAKGGGALLFGRATYDMMASYCPRRSPPRTIPSWRSG
jgi:dihydrofolate reductase